MGRPIPAAWQAASTPQMGSVLKPAAVMMTSKPSSWPCWRTPPPHRGCGGGRTWTSTPTEKLLEQRALQGRAEIGLAPHDNCYLGHWWVLLVRLRESKGPDARGAGSSTK